MTPLDFKEYFDFETSDGKKYTGIITGVENDFETSSGVDEIELDIGDCYLGIEISDIVKVEPVDKIL